MTTPGSGPSAGEGADRARAHSTAETKARTALGRVIWALLVAAGMTAAAGAGMYAIMLYTIRGHEVRVPDLSRMTQEEAEAAARKVELRVEVAGTRIEPKVAAGRIFEQDPPAGSTIRPGRVVKVLVSLAEDPIEVPSLVGQPLRKAQLLLEQLGLRVGDTAHAPSNEVPVDMVLSQRPAGGARRQKGDVVDLLVSHGARERVYVMPALKGLEASKAGAMLQDAGLRVGLTRRDGPGEASGTVIGQQPPEGSPVRQHQSVMLVVAR
jgi:beta-lactam-binding protein with PASTA domain